MASRFEIVDEEYIEELKEKSKNENTSKSKEEERFQKMGERKKLPSKFRRVRERYLRSNSVAVLCRVTKKKKQTKKRG